MTPALSPPCGNSLDPVTGEMDARDAHDSVILLALLIFLWGAVSLFFVPLHPFGVPNTLQVALGGAALIYFIRSRRQPKMGMVFAFAATAIAYSLLLLPWTALVWCAFKRPMEAFTVPQAAIVCMALVIPRLFWCGAVLMGLFAAECLFAYLYAWHVGLYALIPVTEPYASLFFAFTGIGILVLRERRRQVARRRVRARADAEALRRVGPLFTTVRDELSGGLTAIADELDDARDRCIPTMRRALARLHELRQMLDHLVDENGARLPTDASRRIVDRDAHFGVTVFAALMLPVAAFAGLCEHLLGMPNVWIASLPLFLAFLLYLLRTRDRPSESRALWVLIALVAIILPQVSYGQVALLALRRPFAPFLGHKLLMVTVALVAASSLRLGLLLVLATALDGLVLYFALHLAAHRDLIPLAEPWVLVVFLVIAVVALVMRDQRRVASLRLLHDESEVSILHRRAVMLIALRDLLNSPLQAVVLCAARLDGRQVDRARIDRNVARMVALSHELSALDDLVPVETHLASLDAANELRHAR